MAINREGYHCYVYPNAMKISEDWDPEAGISGSWCIYDSLDKAHDMFVDACFKDVERLEKELFNARQKLLQARSLRTQRNL